MNNDTISRSALKSDLKQYFSDGVLDSVSAKLAFNMILRKIDNAPTVDIKDQIAGAYNEGYACGSRENTRPQGERAERALAIIDRLRTDGHINNREQGTLRRAILLPERPQGEWIVFYTPKKKKVFKCDKCMAVSIQGQTKFCHNCGASMKGGAE